MNTSQTIQQLRELKLAAMADSYTAITKTPVNQQPSAHELLAQLTQAELLYRSNRRTNLLLKSSGLRYNAMPELIDYSKSRNLAKEDVTQLLDCSWIHRGENVLITGATGCGKSYLACAFGHQACNLGLKALYINLNRFTEKITMARLDGTFNRLLNNLEKKHLIIIDDFGLTALSNDVKLSLLQILEDRYENKSMIIASQLPVAQWFDYINEPTIADAILDRIIPKAHRFELKGPSLRNKIKS
jgi:DNA replication protein DnaC